MALSKLSSPTSLQTSKDPVGGIVQWAVVSRGRWDFLCGARGGVADPALLLLLPTSLRLATSDAPDAMEEWDVPQMKKEVESLKYQLAFKREMSSKTIPE